MKRDMDLIRALLLKLENLETSYGTIIPLHQDSAEIQVDGYTPEQIGYHISLIVEAGLIDTAGGSGLMGHVFRRLSWEGHDFVDAVRDDKLWARTKGGASAAGGFTLDLLKDLAKGFIRKQIEEKTGISI